MSYLKLIKLLYLADRKSIGEWSRPITTDNHVSMDQGPVVSQIYSLISTEPNPAETSIWHSAIQTQNWDVVLQDTSGCLDEISRAEERLLREVFDEHGSKNRWDIVKETHSLPEWQHPHGSMIPISYEDIIRAIKPREEQEASADSLNALIDAEDIFA